MTLYIKNMVCRRCVLSVEQLLQDLGLSPARVTLGEVTLDTAPTPAQEQALRAGLEALGFDLLDNQRQRMIEKVKSLLIGQVQSGEIPEHFSLVDFIGKAMRRDYSSVSKLFSEVEGITMEHYFILQKIEKVKEWLVYNEHTLSEIAFRLGYSSAAYLSSQFKRVTGMSPSEFKNNYPGHRRGLDKVHNH